MARHPAPYSLRLRIEATSEHVQWLGQQAAKGEGMGRIRSPWFSLGYLLTVALMVIVIVLFVLWLA